MEPTLTPATKLGTTVVWASGVIKRHETLIAIVLGFLLLWGITGKVQSIIAAHDQKVYATDTAALQATAEKNAAAAQSNAALAAQYQQAAALAAQANAALAQANAALSTALTKQKAADATLPPPQLAARIETVASLPPGSITAKPDATLSITLPAAVSVAQMLEEVPVLHTQLDNTGAQKAATEKLLADQTQRVAGLNTQIDGLNLQIVQGGKVCDDRVKVEKDKAAKAKRKWFVAGYVAGLVTRGVIKLTTGL